MQKPTKTQAKVLSFLKSFHCKQQRYPTRAEICQHFGWASTNAADQHLRALEKKGVLSLQHRAGGIFIN